MLGIVVGADGVMDKTFEVYRLVSPSGKSYVGLTSLPFKQRFNSHLNDWKNGSRHCVKLCYAFDKYSPYSYPWAFEHVLKTFNKEEAQNKEVELIKNLDTINSGYNILPGGSLSRIGVPCSEEHRKKLSLALTGRTFTEEHKNNIRKNRPFRGKHLSLETRQKISKAGLGQQRCLGYKHSEETKRKRSEKYSGSGNPNFGKKHSDETKEKIRLSRLGKKASVETRKALSLANLGNKKRLGISFTPEQRRLIGIAVSKATLGRKRGPLSEEWKHNIGIASKLAWQKRKDSLCL